MATSVVIAEFWNGVLTPPVASKEKEKGAWDEDSKVANAETRADFCFPILFKVERARPACHSFPMRFLAQVISFVLFPVPGSA